MHARTHTHQAVNIVQELPTEPYIKQQSTPRPNTNTKMVNGASVLSTMETSI